MDRSDLVEDGLLQTAGEEPMLSPDEDLRRGDGGDAAAKVKLSDNDLMDTVVSSAVNTVPSVEDLAEKGDPRLLGNV